MLDVIEARYLHDYTVWLRFEDGATGEVDLSAELHGPIFEPLPFHGQDDARYGEQQAEPPALRELRRKWLTRREGPEKFRDWIRERR